MKRVLVGAALLAASGLPLLAATSSDMECSHYMAMNAAGQMTTVDSMRSKMPAARCLLAMRWRRKSPRAVRITLT
jgi:hypothetical protein